MRRDRAGAHAGRMFPFTNYEATKMLVDEHIDELRRAGRPQARRRHHLYLPRQRGDRSRQGR